MEVGRCGLNLDRFMNPHEFFKFGNEFHKSLGSPRKPNSKMLRTQSFDQYNRAPKISFTRASADDYMKTLQELSLPCYGQTEVIKIQTIDAGTFGLPRASGIFSWPTSLGSRLNDTGLPVSLKILKRKLCEERENNISIKGGRQTAYCSIKRAFSSTVFIIRELQTYALQMRQILLREDLHEVIGMVQREMQISFVWLFQQVFSSTPIFMVSVMILLANFTVYSMGKNLALAAIPFAGSSTSVICSAEEEIKIIQADRSWVSKYNYFKTSCSSPNPDLAKTGTAHTVETQGNGHPSNQSIKITQLWQCFLKEIESDLKREIDHESLQRLVSATSTHLEPDNYNCYDRTELLYQEAISADPDNALLLSNYAQFLHLVRHDNHRAEEYFGEALRADPMDGDATVKFANFLWLAKGDLFSAEKIYLRAIGIDPKNPFHAGCYAHFLWQTGGA
ncbi:hypothetical protein SUGI_1150620 [Cryptomeria japonica]|uniref:uncharacterized protein LOC131072088 n=1 Tax=Cryptomeria japonica TaxID=3369 RepID=UPI002414C34F|nr:uncharacterized protein LOC131072088 [Cryptomeria japonica]GLJ53876.1 hypothetical protein SUGI_1150620 [Cryptomeria japonica]